MDDTWELRMAARAQTRAGKETAQRHRPLTPDRPGHIGHHIHRIFGGTECSCGTDFQDICVIENEEDEKDETWWAHQQCPQCGQPGALPDY